MKSTATTPLTTPSTSAQESTFSFDLLNPSMTYFPPKQTTTKPLPKVSKVAEEYNTSVKTIPSFSLIFFILFLILI